MKDPVSEAILNQYFRRLEFALGALPDERRKQIIEDVRAHIDEGLRAENDPSEAIVLAILDRLGDPDEIAREAIADMDASTDSAAAHSDLWSSRSRRLGAPVPVRLAVSRVILIVAVVAVVLTVASGRSPASTKPISRHGGSLVAGLMAAETTLPGGWLPATDVSGDHHSPGASDCTPQTTSGSESASALESGASEVASGSVAGHAWSLWSKHGQTGVCPMKCVSFVVRTKGGGVCPAV